MADYDKWLEDERIRRTESPVWAYCNKCKGEIYEGYNYYEYGNKIYCEDCIHEVLEEEFEKEFEDFKLLNCKIAGEN